ncbi:MAG: hypothetical protein WCR67_05345 [Bacilli bacterium]
MKIKSENILSFFYYRNRQTITSIIGTFGTGFFIGKLCDFIKDKNFLMMGVTIACVIISIVYVIINLSLGKRQEKYLGNISNRKDFTQKDIFKCLIKDDKKYYVFLITSMILSLLILFGAIVYFLWIFGIRFWY